MTGKDKSDILPGNVSFYQDLVEHSRNLIQCFDSEGKFVYVNQAWLKTLKYAAEEAAGLTLWQIIHPDSMEHCKALFEQIITGKDVGEIEAVFVAKDGTPVAVEGSVSVKLDEKGRFIQTHGIFSDVTERKKAEEELRKSESLFKKVFEILPIGLWIADKSGKLIQGNPAGVKIWGMEPKVGQSEYGVFKARRLPSNEEIAPED